MLMREIKYHKTLNPKIWLPNNTMDPAVARTLRAVALDYVDYMRAIGFPMDRKNIREIFVYGSNANFFYDKNSDIDVCIVADLTDVLEMMKNVDFFTLYKSLLHTWHRQFALSIRGLGIDLSLEHVDKPKNDPDWYRSGPAYSVISNTWVHPLERLSDATIREYRERGREIANNILREARAVAESGGRLDEFVRLQQKLRDDSMRANYQQPITPETIAFKMVRNTGLFIKLLRESSQRRAKKQFRVD